jgi:hypothetical protein
MLEPIVSFTSGLFIGWSGFYRNRVAHLAYPVGAGYATARDYWAADNTSSQMSP